MTAAINTRERRGCSISIIRDFTEVTSLSNQLKKMESQQFLQSLVDQFNTHSRSSVLLTKKCSELKEHKHYIIHSIKKMETTHGEAILVSLSEAPFTPGDEPKFQIFLPKRFVTLLQNEDLRAIQPGSLYLVSHGASGNNSTELTLHITHQC
jgi:hypothetical protein